MRLRAPPLTTRRAAPTLATMLSWARVRLPVRSLRSICVRSRHHDNHARYRRATGTVIWAKTTSQNSLCQTPVPQSVRCLHTGEPALLSASVTMAADPARQVALYGLAVADDMRTLILTGVKGQNICYNATWLRHNCQCSQCVQPHSRQKTLEPHLLQPNYTIHAAYIKGDVVYVEWRGSEAHVGELPLSFLLDHDYSQHARQQRALQKIPAVCRNNVIPSCSYEEITEPSGKGFFRWLENLNDYGICLIKDLPTESGMVTQVCDRVWRHQHTIYGEVFEVVSTDQPINIAYSDAKLGFHMDLIYYESAPGIQFLHCLRLDDCVTGGESMFVDVWHVAEELRRLHPQHFRTLTRVPATFQKLHQDREHPVHMVYRKAHIIVSPDGMITAVNWAPPFEGPLSVPEEDIEPYYEAYHTFAQMLETSETRTELRLQPGNMIGFNNRRILHARQQFQSNGGIRHLEGCYLNIDEFKSEVEVQSQKFAKGKPAKHVFNQDRF